MSSTLYSTSAWRRVRRVILRRDGYRCRAIETYGNVTIRCPVVRGLQVHHIVRPEDGGAPYAESNLITLCKAHHSRLERRLDVPRQRVVRPKRKTSRPNAAAYQPFDRQAA